MITKNRRANKARSIEKLREETVAFVEKKGKKFGFRGKEMCMWQQKYLFVTTDSICYQALTVSKKVHGSITEIPFNEVMSVGRVGKMQGIWMCA